MSAIFFKTRLCISFTQRGYCSKGDGCGFAHGNAELRQPPPNWQEIITNSGNPPQNRIPNQQLYCNGDRGCGQYQYRDNAPAAKEFSEYSGHREQQQMMVGGGINVNVGGGINHSDPHRSRSAFWKTKLCFKFKNTGFCAYGDNCQFAHGEAELRRLGGNTVVYGVNFEAGGPSKPAAPHASSTQMLQQQTPNQDYKFSELKGGAIYDCVQQTHQDKKPPFEWKGPKRMSLIYGDWIDY